ncbi:uncharacterized protein LOC141705221 [Apium graveolens]|uniref:uncharacterized protein LOC141705221 n=1 Tax=Apium graveolens TaxID=4045 RepID=UPI003D7B1AB0
MANKSKRDNTTGGVKLQEVEKWQPPEEGSFKVNVDAAIQEGSESFSIGMVIRDHTGTFIEGKVMSFPSPESVFAAEAIGMREALSWIADKGLHKVTFESDSLLTVKALQNREDNQLEVGHILSSCLDWLTGNPSFVVSFVKRHVNKVAHELERCPCLVNCYNLFTSPPDLLLETLMFDHSF